MATSHEFMTYISDQLNHIPHIRMKKMFGEYGIFMYEKMVAILADDQLFVKPTEKTLTLKDDFMFAPPYPGAKPYIVIEDIEDRMFLKTLFELTYEELPLPKPKKRRHYEKNRYY
ncbi:MAG: TfoX/Sxy family protein [Acholeplasmataceae bacterium]|jgi:TfoX/Sxy family transcriptional regulator of competence genes|nr:TfoX/Sxy family protein [Acholeplasmataceae bacterium]